MERTTEAVMECRGALASHRGILKYMPAAVTGDRQRTAEADLSGRHLERLPTSLFSSLHLTSINLSHNLLTPKPCRRRQAEERAKRRERRAQRRRPQLRKERRDVGDRAPNDCTSVHFGDDDGLSVDSGLPPDPVEEEITKGGHKGRTWNVRSEKSLVSDKTAPGPASGSPTETQQVWESIAEELQAKLRSRKARIEGLATGDEALASAFVAAQPAAARSPPRRLSIPEVVKSTVRGDEQRAKSEGSVGNEQSSSSGVDESESGSEAGSEEQEEEEEEAARGSNRRACPSKTLGELHHLRHFQQLQVVALARNRLQAFPACLLSLPGLTRLFLGHNLLRELPHSLARLTRLLELDVSYNRLVGLGAGVGGLQALAHLRVAHNRISDAPELATMEALQTLDMSGNQVRTVPSLGVRSSALHEPHPASSYTSKDAVPGEASEPLALNLRLNSLTGPVTLASIQNVTELDVSDNGISSLDVSCLAGLTRLACSNNSITSITLHGAALTSLTATNNRLTMLEVRYHPRRLTHLNLARNELSAVPPWLVSSTEATLVDVSHNQVTSLPAFLTSGHLHRLHTLSAHHNRLTAFPVPQQTTIPDNYKDSSSCASHGAVKGPHKCSQQSHSYGSFHSLHEEPRLCSLEVLLLHHNKLTVLPPHLFSWLNRLRVLNVSTNQLSALPGMAEGGGVRQDIASPKVTLSLQELYAAANKLKDLTPLHYCRALRILHAPYNRINSLQDRLVWSWELLEELVLSGNHLTEVPAGVSRLRRLRLLKVHTNPLKSLPRLAHLSALKVVDASHCQLGRVELEELVSPGLVALDVSGNSALSLDHHQFTKCKSRRQVSVVDVTSRAGRSLPLTRPQANSARPNQGQPGGSSHSSHLPWSLGFAEAIGRDSKLTVGQLRVPDVSGLGHLGIAAVADGGREVGSVGSLLTALPTLLQEECACSQTRTYALKYALLTVLRRLKSEGAILPDAVCAAHLEADTTHSIHQEADTLHPVHWPVLRLCSYGSVTATVTTTHGQPIVLTTTAPRTLPSAGEECREGMKCVLAEPGTLPDPQMTELHLGPHHTAVIIASASLWEVIEPREVADVCREVSEPSSAAKRLLDLAQAYGTRQALSIIVIRLSPSNLQRHSYLPISSLEQVKTKTTTVAHSYSPHESGVGSGEERSGNSRRVKFDRTTAIVDDPSSNCLVEDQRKYSVKRIDFDSYSLLKNAANNNNVAKLELEEKSLHHSPMGPGVVELDRSSPSGQSQSDYSENCVDIYKHASTITREPIPPTKHKDVPQKSVEDLYAQPHRRKKETGRKADAEPKISNSRGRRAVTYYHYPRPDPAVTPAGNHLAEHLLSLGQIEAQTSVLAPPAGFGDVGSDSEGSDSGLSGVSGGQQRVSPQNFPNSEDDPNNDSQQVTEEQFRSWEYLLARNAKLLFMRELDSLSRPETMGGARPSASAPDLVLAAAAETEANGHFQRNPVRKSRLGRGTFRLIQNKLCATTSRFNTLQKIKSTNSKTDSNFRRFGSLQNLKYYEENRPRPPHYPLVQPDLAAEMQERPTLDSLELETRMHHYWHTGVTNF